MATENVKDRKIYRILVDEVNKVWDRLNFLTNAKSVDAEDGENLETKVGAIKGITTSTTVTENGWAMDAKTVNENLAGINTEMSALKKSVADGKALIASAITSKGVGTAADAAFSAMASNIGKIPVSTGSTITKLYENTTSYKVPANGSGHGSITGYVNLTNYSSVVIYLGNYRSEESSQYLSSSVSGISVQALVDQAFKFYFGASPKRGINITGNFAQSSSAQQTAHGKMVIWGIK